MDRSEFREWYRHIAQFCIDFHYSAATCQSKELCIGPLLAREFKCFLLDASCQSMATELIFYNETRVGNVLFITPTLNVTEACKFIICKRNDSLALLHLLRHILMSTFCDTRTTHLRRSGDGLKNLIYILLV